MKIVDVKTSLSTLRAAALPGAFALLLAFAAAAPEPADAQARTRPSGSTESASSAGSSGSSSSSSASGQRRAVPRRGTTGRSGGRSRPTADRDRRGGDSPAAHRGPARDRSRASTRHHHSGRRFFHPGHRRFGDPFFFGGFYGYPYSGFYGHPHSSFFGSPYFFGYSGYPWGLGYFSSAYYSGYHRHRAYGGGYRGHGERYERYERRYEQGGLDLNVIPKRTQVWVDGRPIGKAGRYDGFPSGHLWLEEGVYDFVFHRPGYRTEHREVRVYPDTVIAVDLLMEKGESEAPEAVFERIELERGGPGGVPPAPPAATERGASGYAYEAPPPARHGEPASLRLEVEPPDASVYLDGRFLGTGEELSRLHGGLSLAPGEHFLAVVRPGHATRELVLEVEPGEETSLEVVLQRERR